MVGCLKQAVRLQMLSHSLIDLLPRRVIGRNDDSVLRVSDVVAGDSVDSALRVSDLYNATLFLKHLDADSCLVPGKAFDSFEQFGVLLTHDLVKLHGGHSGLL